MSKPLLSVCLITYNQAQYIKQAVDSILEQEADFHWELIIADDYSTDGTREILRDYKNRFPDLINLILQKSNVGPEKNWLDLMSNHKSKYVLYTEGDDYFTDPAKLQTQVDFLEAHVDISLCFHPVKVIYEDGSRPDELFPLPERRAGKNLLEVKDLLVSNFIQTNSAMYRWRFIKEDIKYTFPKNISPGDWLLHILHAQTGKIGFIDRVMSVYRRHPGGLWWDSHKDKNKLWEKYGIAHLNLYEEMLRLYGDNKDYDKIIFNHIYETFGLLIELRDMNNSRVLEDALLKFPEFASRVMSDQRRIIARKDYQLENLTQELQDRISDYDGLGAELNAIKNSKSWRTARRLSKARSVLPRKNP